jgi:Fe-S-cluster containining protein
MCPQWEIDILPSEILKIWNNIKDKPEYDKIIFPFFTPNQFEEGDEILYFLAEQPVFGNIVKSRFVLSKDLKGRCVFLDEKNRCSIYNLRPFSCRAFPVGAQDTRICPAMKDKPSLDKVEARIKKYAKNPENDFLKTTKLYDTWNKEIVPKANKYLKPTIAGFMEYCGLLPLYLDPQFRDRVLRGRK